MFDSALPHFCRSATPESRSFRVWALPLSLAATKGISVDFSSSGYLDVSVHRVPSVRLCIHRTVTWLSPRRVSPFGHPWINAHLQLPMAFRSLSRPSSALGAKASALCFLSLDLLDQILKTNQLPSSSFALGHFSCPKAEIVGSQFYLFPVTHLSMNNRAFSLCFVFRFAYYAVVRVRRSFTCVILQNRTV